MGRCVAARWPMYHGRQPETIDHKDSVDHESTENRARCVSRAWGDRTHQSGSSYCSKRGPLHWLSSRVCCARSSGGAAIMRGEYRQIFLERNKPRDCRKQIALAFSQLQGPFHYVRWQSSSEVLELENMYTRAALAIQQPVVRVSSNHNRTDNRPTHIQA